MDAVVIVPFADRAHREQAVALWKDVFGYESAHNDPALAVDRKIAVDDGLFFVALKGGTVIGTAMAGYDGHRGWIYSVAVSAAHRQRGVGTRLVRHAEQVLVQRGC